MALVGNLRDFGLSEFLYLVDRGAKTGRLTLQKPGDRAELYFNTGKLVYATHFNQDERIGDILVRMGRVTREQCNIALEIQQAKQPDKPVGQIMVELGMLTQAEILKCVRLQIEEITYGLFGWQEGDFRFEPDMAPPRESVSIPLSIENLIMEGTRRIDEWARIRDRIPSLDVIVRFSDKPHEKAKGVNLTPDEWRVFARINGANSVRQISLQTGLGDFETARIIYGFLSAGLVILTKEIAQPTPVSPGLGGTLTTGPLPPLAPFDPDETAPAPGPVAPAPRNRFTPRSGIYETRPGKEAVLRLIAHFGGAF
ncbi:MAG: DUF4388 domain-containing protein [Chloroflexi bacterium]|nr:DUF4388 domain-containing protein [Chloroflexota bacterium]OJV98362.1 MAG: hypothetical protein BGO39_16445 [Chloroflexi bacterium 54-19]